MIGAGVIGLSTARLVQEAGFEVSVYAKDLPPRTTSDVAGGQWYPYHLYDEKRVTAAWRKQYESAATDSWRRFQNLVGDDYGVRWLPTYTDSIAEQPPFAGFPPNMRTLSGDEHPFAIDTVAAYDTMYVETGRYLQRLIRDVQAAGGRIYVREFRTVGDISGLEEQLVFNCTGLGARQLFGDDDLIPVRGQLAVLLPQPEVRYAYSFKDTYMFPRPDGIVLGGTAEEGIWDVNVQPKTIAKILTAHQRLFDDYRCTPGNSDQNA
ncbi:FAD-dependent oxidoreductase [Mycobacterium sp.]|uniref:FAD-dependent oxidoreductase n=1 Tax=Mycobacterium sp. TaxID=1785 RepID=UPI003BAD3328